MNISDKGKRFGNYIIDLIAIIIIEVILIPCISFFIYPEISNTNSITFKFYFYIGFFLYYFLFEVFTNKTLGKILTKTIVVDKKGNKPSIFKIFIRTICRLIPFDMFTFLFGT